jgi:uncharacterized membrane protein YdfJ with MMPL/SSD domain
VDALTTFVLRHRRLVAACWLVALAAGGFASAILSKHLSESFEIPGAASDAADRAIVATYHSGGSEDPLVPVVRLPAGGLGVAIDYSLLLITRWREARGRGMGNEEAIRAAMATAGRRSCSAA